VERGRRWLLENGDSNPPGDIVDKKGYTQNPLTDEPPDIMLQITNRSFDNT
jgi:hypothetical protein